MESFSEVGGDGGARRALGDGYGVAREVHRLSELARLLGYRRAVDRDAADSREAEGCPSGGGREVHRAGIIDVAAVALKDGKRRGIADRDVVPVPGIRARCATLTGVPGASLLRVIGVVPDLDDARSEPGVGEGMRARLEARDSGAVEGHRRGAEGEAEGIADGGRRGAANRRQRRFEAIPLAPFLLHRHEVVDALADKSGLSVVGGHEEVERLARASLQVHVGLVEGEHQGVLVGRDPDVDPVAGTGMQGAHVELDSRPV